MICVVSAPRILLNLKNVERVKKGIISQTARAGKQLMCKNGRKSSMSKEEVCKGLMERYMLKKTK